MGSILQDLGSNTQQRFVQSKFIRTLTFSLSGCYALRKLAIHLTEPHHTLAVTADTAIRFRQGKTAGRPIPFRAPWLVTHQLDRHLRRILLTWFFHVRHTQTAFHDPSFKIIYVKHPALQDALCNHNAAIQNWSDDIQPKCTCELLRKYPQARSPLNKAEDHWVLRGSLLAPYLVPSQATLVSGSLNNKLFHNQKAMASQFTEAFHQWCKRSSIPLPTDHWIKQCFDPLWQDHQNRITSYLSSKSAKQVQDLFPNCVFHNEDKKASSLLIYCPVLYNQCIQATFADPKIFRPLRSSPLSTLDLTKNHLTNFWGKSYPWSMGKGNTLPAAYILPKGKKSYNSARPIISFFGAPFRPMLNALAKLLYQLTPQACPHHFALGDVYTLLSHLRAYAQSHPSIIPLHIFPRPRRVLHQHRYIQIFDGLASGPTFPPSQNGPQPRGLLLSLSQQSQQPWRSYQGPNLPIPECDEET